MTIYERIENLRHSQKISQGKLEKELGFSNGSISKWKNSMPTPERLQKIADYFGVTVDYLMTGKDHPKEKPPELTVRDERDIERKLTETLAQLESGDGLMFNGEVLDEETKRLLEISLRSTIESAKIAAKKFTPNKYKK